MDSQLNEYSLRSNPVTLSSYRSLLPRLLGLLFPESTGRRQRFLLPQRIIYLRTHFIMTKRPFKKGLTIKPITIISERNPPLIMTFHAPKTYMLRMTLTFLRGGHWLRLVDHLPSPPIHQLDI